MSTSSAQEVGAPELQRRRVLSPENRQKVLDLVVRAPQSARDLFRLGEEGGKIVWWWQRLTLVAKR